MTGARPEQPLSAEQVLHLGTMTVDEAVTNLTQRNALTAATVEQLAVAALHKADHDPAVASHWLTIAEAVETRLSGTPARQALLAYANARIHVHQGELTTAEALLRQAQAQWQAAGDAAGYSRSLLGLTQILAMQGRYAEAEAAARTAVTHSETGPTPTAVTEDAFTLLMRRAAAHHNLATLLLYQERHSEALPVYEALRQFLTAGDQDATQAAEERRAELLSKLAHSDLNRGTALTFLDRPVAAEAALQQAIDLFAQVDDPVNLGRSRTNLGRLHLRTGQYAAALANFERAFRDLLGPTTTIASATTEQLRAADELLLEYAIACLVINLLPEAGQALAHCETLFRHAAQPYELGQTRYSQGLLFLRTQQWKLAQAALTEAATLFAALQNAFWLNRTRLAQASIAYLQQQFTEARHLLDLLTATPTDQATVESALHWDMMGQTEARLLRLRLALEEGDLAEARHQATLVEILLQGDAPASAGALPWPHLQLRLQHMLGKIAFATGDYQRARHHLKTALDQLERQRTTLVVEEMRSAFVDDKSELYADLVQTLFTMAPNDAPTVAEAFAVIEQSRSRVLLERLLAAIDESVPTAAPGEVDTTPADPVVAAERQRVTALREQLHWLYNQLMSESGHRRLGASISQQLQMTEAALQQIEWRQSPLLAQAQAVDLPAFQQVLAPDQQAIVYAGMNGELLAFLIDRTSVQVFRRLTTMAELERAIAEFRFQMGRVEVDPAYVARHSVRLESRLQAALHALYQHLIAPFATALYAERLLFVPFGQIHRLPLHALWDGAAYLIERAECSYAPSASLAVFRHDDAPSKAFQSWAGFAIADPAIPEARTEVDRIARHFTQATTYLENSANRPNLWQAAATNDILHLATHGLFRPDNPFFSALKMADGWVDVRELYRLPLAARLVVLSACESGVGEIAGGDEVVGLARGFLGAGREPTGRELIASLWNVHDATAADLMEQFYTHLLAGGSVRPAAALRAAQRRAITSRQHPYYWAPFFVIGS